MAATPEARFAPELLLQAQGRVDGGNDGGFGIRAAIFDVDGVLTDGRLYIGEAGEVFKAFHVLDGHGLKLLGQAGIAPVVITGRDSAAVRRRMADLGLAMKIIRIERDQSAIDALESDLLKFLAMVRENESKLRKAAQAANAAHMLQAA